MSSHEVEVGSRWQHCDRWRRRKNGIEIVWQVESVSNRGWVWVRNVNRPSSRMRYILRAFTRSFVPLNAADQQTQDRPDQVAADRGDAIDRTRRDPEDSGC